jgi:hypothetical protein
MIAKILAPSVPKHFSDRLKAFDKNLKAVFNCGTERWEIYRYSRGRWHWIIAVENDDESYRPLDERVFRKLYEIDIIARYGSVANYERHLDEKKKRWQDNEQKNMDYELRCDIKDDRKLWQRAAENFRSGKVNDPPEEKERKIFSYSNQGGKR